MLEHRQRGADPIGDEEELAPLPAPRRTRGRVSPSSAQIENVGITRSICRGPNAFVPRTIVTGAPYVTTYALQSRSAAALLAAYGLAG